MKKIEKKGVFRESWENVKEQRGRVTPQSVRYQASGGKKEIECERPLKEKRNQGKKKGPQPRVIPKDKAKDPHMGGGRTLAAIGKMRKSWRRGGNS